MANTCGGGISDTRRSGTTTSVTTMSRLPVAAMPSTCQVSFTSTSSTGSRKLRAASIASPSIFPLTSTQSAWQMPVPKVQ